MSKEILIHCPKCSHVFYEEILSEKKDFTERIIELIKDDKALHDATVRLINAQAEQTEINNKRRKEKK